ncbi:MAG TPA: ABC transporter permease [Nakamurella sp.]|nr:ABC transporter permease [Nakamurella sp.]
MTAARTAVARAGADVLDPDAARQARRHRAWVIWLRVAVLVLVVGGWELLARTGVIDPFFFSYPSEIIQQVWIWAKDGTQAGPLWQQVAVTVEEAIIGFVIGVVLGVAFGVALGRVRILSEVFGPYIKVLNSIPRIVLGSILIVWLGLGIASKVALAVVLVFFAVFFNAFQGTREVDRNLVANARILGASKAQVTWQVVLPSAFTWIIASMHTSFGFALIGAIVGEFLGARKGLGLLITTAQGTFNPSGIFAAMLIIAVVALIAEGLMGLLEARLLSWRPPQLSGADL